MAIRSEKITALMMLVVSMVLIAASAVGAAATIDEKEKNCASEMGNLASCIPFVSGSAKKPTAQCCEETKKVKENKPECLCVMIKESTDPSLGLPVNTTLALQMPSACNIDAKVSDCPTILNLPQNSPDAKIFEDAEGSSSNTSSSSSSSPQTTTESNTKTATAIPSKTDASNSIKSTKENFIVYFVTIAVFSVLM